MAKTKLIPYTVEELHEIFEEKEPGVLYRKKRTIGINIKKPSGTMSKKNGYCYIRMHGRRYLRHRLIWKMHAGQEPPEVIDHILGIENGDVFTNLQESNQSHNQNKKRIQRNNTSGMVGVTWYNDGKKWRAYIKSKGKTISLGYFFDKEEAHKAYLAAKDIYHDGARALE